jgi:hypothetical protein
MKSLSELLKAAPEWLKSSIQANADNPEFLAKIEKKLFAPVPTAKPPPVQFNTSTDESKPKKEEPASHVFDIDWSLKRGVPAPKKPRAPYQWTKALPAPDYAGTDGFCPACRGFREAIEGFCKYCWLVAGKAISLKKGKES